VFGYISVVVVEGACVRYFSGLGFYKFGIVGWSVGDEGIGGRDSLLTVWGEWEGKVRTGGEIG
jgi:hypothetical protein